MSVNSTFKSKHSSPFKAATQGKLFKAGDVILHEWYKQFLLEDGNADVVAIIMLGDIVAWYRNGTADYSGYFGGQAPVLDGDSLIISYEYYDRKFNFKESKARRALARLDNHRVLKKGFKNIAVAGGKRINKLVITLDLTFFKSCFIDPSLDIRGIGRKKKSAGVPHCDDHISRKNLEVKDRSRKSNLKFNFLEFSKNIEKIDSQLIATDELNNIYEKKNFSLASFYPLSQSDIKTLRRLCGRQFSGNAINQILLKLSKKYLLHSFPNKRAFISYMSKALTYELRDAVKVSNESFRIKSNISADEQVRILEESFLSKIENNRDTSLSSVLARKLAGVLEPSIAYNLLSGASFPRNNITTDNDKDTYNPDNNILKIKLHKKIELNSSQYDAILTQVKAVYGNHINSLNLELKLTTSSNSSYQKNDSSSTPNIAPRIFKGVWGRVRQALIDNYGEATDRNWFSKLEVFEDQDKSELRLKAPTSFVRDWISQNYQDLIEKICTRENYQLAGVSI